MSLLVKDLTKKEFDAITSIDPSEITFKPITEETLATEATLLSPTRIPEPLRLEIKVCQMRMIRRVKEQTSAPAAPATTPAPAAPTPTPVPAATPAPPAPPLPPVSRKINRFNVTINKI